MSDIHISIIHEMLRNILNCPTSKCSACKKSVDVAFTSLNSINDILLDKPLLKYESFEEWDNSESLFKRSNKEAFEAARELKDE